MDNLSEKKIGSGPKNVKEMFFLVLSHFTARKHLAIFCAAPILLKFTR